MIYVTISLQARGYVSRKGRALRAEPLGRVLTAFLTSYFPRYLDYGFTADMESLLDAVSGESVYPDRTLTDSNPGNNWTMTTT